LGQGRRQARDHHINGTVMVDEDFAKLPDDASSRSGPRRPTMEVTFKEIGVQGTK